MTRRPPLARLFAELNASHFAGRLPRISVRRVRDDRAPVGCVIEHAGRLALLIHASERVESERRTLLHEMCHVATRDEKALHGEAWQAEMRRLAREHGELWAEEEVQQQDADPATAWSTVHDFMAEVRALARRPRAWHRAFPRGLPVVAVVALLGFALAAQAQTRVDLYDRQSKRTGSATIDERTGRIDTYDTRSNRTGYGTIDQRSGRIDLFDTRGNRVGSGTLTPSGSALRKR